MLLANSFLLMATAYATDNKAIVPKSENAKQNIEEIIMSNWTNNEICSILLFDKSWSMCPTYHHGDYQASETKRIDAVSWAIAYSETLIDEYPKANIWLITFNTKLDTRKPLSRDRFTKKDFWRCWWNTNLGLAIDEAIDMLIASWDVCKISNIVIMSDWVPTDDIKPSANRAINKWIIIYSLWYDMYWGWKDTLRKIAGGWFYEANPKTVETVFKKILDDQNKPSSIKENHGKLKIESKNLIISRYTTWTNSNTINNSSNCSILWWKKNTIAAQSSQWTIIAWYNNTMQYASSSSILWWKNHRLISDSYLSTIIWWSANTIEEWVKSSIWWWENNIIKTSSNSTIIWNNNNITNWSFSVAMWNKTNITGWNNSFYWTDWDSSKTLTESNVFAIMSTHGMAINTNTPHDAAQLTISWNLAIKPNSNDINIKCWNWNWKGIIKAVKKNDSGECLCSCNWNERKSLHNWICKWLCSNSTEPTCWTVWFDSTSKSYKWSCNSWTTIENSYYVNNENTIHRACQWNDGSVVNCTWNLQ